MTKVVIVGEIYEQNVQIGGGPMPGGGGPVDPGWGQGHPIGGHPGNRPPGSWSGNYPTGGPVYPGGPTDPGYGRPGWSPVDPGWGGGGRPHPGGGPMPGGERPDNTLPEVLPQGGTEVPEDVYTPTPPPEDISSQYIVSVYDPKTMTWTTKSYPPR